MDYRPPIITILNDHEFELVEPFTYEWQEETDHVVATQRITIPKGDCTDGASVPRICWSLTGLLPTGVHMGAAAMHDYLYQRRGELCKGEYERLKNNGEWVASLLKWDRKQCDDLFLRIMQEAGETPWKANLMHWAVRVFGGAAWDN